MTSHTPLEQLRNVIQTLYEAQVAISDYAGPQSVEAVQQQMFVTCVSLIPISTGLTVCRVFAGIGID